MYWLAHISFDTKGTFTFSFSSLLVPAEKWKCNKWLSMTKNGCKFHWNYSFLYRPILQRWSFYFRTIGYGIAPRMANRSGECNLRRIEFNLIRYISNSNSSTTAFYRCIVAILLPISQWRCHILAISNLRCINCTQSLPQLEYRPRDPHRHFFGNQFRRTYSIHPFERILWNAIVDVNRYFFMFCRDKPLQLVTYRSHHLWFNAMRGSQYELFANQWSTAERLILPSYKIERFDF